MFYLASIQFARSGFNVLVLLILYFTYSETDIAMYFILLAKIQIGFSIFGFFTTQHFMKKYLFINNVDNHISRKQVFINTLSYLLTSTILVILDPDLIIFSIFFCFLILSRTLDDFYKTRPGQYLFICANLYSLVLSTTIKFGLIYLKIDLIYLALLMFLEDLVRLIFYNFSDRVSFFLLRITISKKVLKYVFGLIKKTLPVGASYFAFILSTRIIFIESEKILGANTITILGYAQRIIDTATGIIVQLSISLFVRDRIIPENIDIVMQKQWKRIFIALVGLIVLTSIGGIVGNKYFNIHLAYPVLIFTAVFLSFSSIHRVAWIISLKDEGMLYKNSFCMAFLIVLFKFNVVLVSDIWSYVIMFLLIYLINSPFFDQILSKNSTYAKCFRNGLRFP